MARSVLSELNIHPAVRDKVAQHQADIVGQVQAAWLATPWW